VAQFRYLWAIVTNQTLIQSIFEFG
jgi:hypothetical protein